MSTYLFAAPLLPGKTESWKKYVKEVDGLRREEHHRARQRAGMNVEQVWLQHTPSGDMAVVRLETDDPRKLFDYLMKSDDPFDRWFRDKILTESHGLDLTEESSPNEKILGYQDEAFNPNTYAFVMPIPSGKAETLRKNLTEMREQRYDELHRRNQKIGLHAVQVWLQRTPKGDFAVVRWDTDNPQKVYDYMATSQEPFDKWFREKILGEGFGVTFDKRPSINERVFSYSGQPVGQKAYTGTRNR